MKTQPWTARAALLVYGWLMRAGQGLLRRKLARRSQHEPAYAQAVEERFGYYSQPLDKPAERLWLHAVSLGETRAAAVLLQALRAQHPGLRIVLTHGTATGRTEGAALLQPGDVQVWQPWDSPAAVARFLQHFQPRACVLMETEVWPQLMAAAQARGLPVLLVNARLSDKSLRLALRWRCLALPAYAALTAVYAQTSADAERLQQLGAPVAGVMGNIKFDAPFDAQQQARGQAWRQALGQPVIMLASAREGEEEQFLKAFAALAQEKQAGIAINSVANKPQPALKYLIVPRHPQRFVAVAALLAEHGLRVSCRSAWADDAALPPEALAADVWLGDSVGEMALYYALSDVALLGGSFAPLGGQNLMEAAALGCPVVMGPHTFNFSEAACLAETAGAAQRVADMPAGLRAALALVDGPQAQAQAAAAGRAFAADNRGATAKTVAALHKFLFHF